MATVHLVNQRLQSFGIDCVAFDREMDVVWREEVFLGITIFGVRPCLLWNHDLWGQTLFTVFEAIHRYAPGLFFLTQIRKSRFGRGGSNC